MLKCHYVVPDFNTHGNTHRYITVKNYHVKTCNVAFSIIYV